MISVILIVKLFSIVTKLVSLILIALSLIFIALFDSTFNNNTNIPQVKCTNKLKAFSSLSKPSNINTKICTNIACKAELSEEKKPRLELGDTANNERIIQQQNS